MPNPRGYRPSVRQSIPPGARLEVWINGRKVSRRSVDRDVASGMSLRRSLYNVFRLADEQYDAFAHMFGKRAKLFKSGLNYKLVLNFEPLVVHVAGPSGAGKTTLGRRLKADFGDRIEVKDLDDLRAEFIAARYHGEPFASFDKESYQAYIDKFVESHKFLPLVWVGLNEMPWWHKGHFYNVHATHQYYITLDDETVLKQKCRRFLAGLADSEADMQYLVDHNERYLVNVTRALQVECNLQQTVTMNADWAKAFKSQGYQFGTRDEIAEDVSDVLNKQIRGQGVSNGRR